MACVEAPLIARDHSADQLPVEVQGHRGFGDEAPHNSLAAIDKAASLPAVRSVEFDVRKSADGHLVVTHGPEQGGGVPLTLEELRDLDVGGGEPVPLLDEVVDACVVGGLKMNVELKEEEDMSYVDDIIDLMRGKSALPYCRFSSFRFEMLERVMQLEPDVPIGALYHTCTDFVDPTDPSKGTNFEKEPADFASWFGDHDVEGDSVNVRAAAVLADPSILPRAKKHGKQVLVWFPSVANEGFEDGEESYRQLVEMGVDVICCNQPSVLANLLGNDDICRWTAVH